MLTKAYYREARSGPLDTLIQRVGWVMQAVGLGPSSAPRSLGEMKDLQISCWSHLTRDAGPLSLGIAPCPCQSVILSGRLSPSHSKSEFFSLYLGSFIFRVPHLRKEDVL